jgi:methylenetetrahydrofolate reductase (NADPH)
MMGETGMTKKLTDVFAEKERTISFEFFPPRTEKGTQRLYETAAELAGKADFFNVTYGAGGSSSKATFDIVVELQKRFNLPVVHHFTCVQHPYAQISEALDRFEEAGIRNVLAMRGDPPADNPDYKPGPDEPHFGYELIRAIRQHSDYFCIGAPGFPEGHPQTPTKELDSEYLKVKQDEGAEFVITQLFFENDIYYEFRERVREVGVTARLLPGILTITDFKKLGDFCATCGASIPQSVTDIFAPIADDLDATREKGIEFTIKQCRDLLENDTPGLHFYCLNKTEPVTTVYNALSL